MNWVNGLEYADGWVITNLKTYRNSSIPNDTILALGGAKQTAYFLSMILHEPVIVRYAETAGYIAEVVMV